MSSNGGRRVTFYRLGTGRTCTVIVPEYGVLRKNTVQRLASVLGGAGWDCPQLTGSPLQVVEVDLKPEGEIGAGGVALKFRLATAADVAALAAAIKNARGPSGHEWIMPPPAIVLAAQLAREWRETR